MFITEASSPATLDPVSLPAKAAFVRRLLAEERKSSLSTGFDPAVISARITQSGREAEMQDKITDPTPHFAVFGSSHMQQTIVQLRQTRYRVKDLTQKSWVMGKKSCDALGAALLADRIPMGTTVVLDLFGNTSTKFKQEDDTLALAVKHGGGGGGGTCWVRWSTLRITLFAEQVTTLR